MILIGIDPDTKKSGVAVYNKQTKKLELTTFTFFELFDYFLFEKNLITTHKIDLKVIIEAGWLNKSNWHTENKNKNISTMIGNRTGANHEIGRKIVEMCEYLGLKYELAIPKKSKVAHEYFKKLTGVIEKTNQEERDAAMLVWGY
jgi:hypothetical protein